MAVAIANITEFGPSVKQHGGVLRVYAMTALLEHRHLQGAELTNHFHAEGFKVYFGAAEATGQGPKETSGGVHSS